MDRQTGIPARILIDGLDVRVQVRVAVFSPYVLALDTTLPDHGIELHSTYTGHETVMTRVIHLLLAPAIGETITASHEHVLMPVVYERQRCLYDHLAHLQDLFKRLGLDARIELEDRALAVIGR